MTILTFSKDKKVNVSHNLKKNKNKNIDQNYSNVKGGKKLA